MSSPAWDYIAKLVCIGDSGCGKSSLTIRLCEGRFVAHHDVTIGVEFGSRIVPVGPPHGRSLPPAASLSSSPPTAALAAAAAAAADDASSAGPSTSAPAAGPDGGLPAPPRTKKKPPPPAPDARQQHMKLSLWDTAGQETYKSVTRSYFRGASGALLVFDLTRRSTFLHATDWLTDLRQLAEPDTVIVLVGNKADLTLPDAGGEGGAAARGNRREVTRGEAAEWARRNGVLEYVETSAKSGENVEAAFVRVAERIYQNIQAGKYDLNDKRSGVKGPGAGAAGSRSVKIEAGKAAAGGCC